jgi:hypothetical protein
VDNALAIAQAAFGELGLSQPSQLAGGNSQDGIQTLALLNRAGKEIANFEGGWPELRGEQQITLVPDQEAYDFPTDILYYKPSSSWDQTSHWKTYGPLSDREWQAVKSSIGVFGPRIRWRLMDGQIHFDPLPSTTDLIVFEYISKNWCQSASGTAQSSFLSDTDVPIITDDLLVLSLKWRILAARGFNYAEEKALYEEALNRRAAQLQATDVLNINQRGPRIGPSSLTGPLVGGVLDDPGDLAGMLGS